MVRKVRGRNKVSTLNEFVENNMGKNPAIRADNKEAWLLFVIFLLIKYEVKVIEAIKMLGMILATIVIGKKRVNKAIK